MTATKAVTQDVQELAEELGGFAQRLQELLRRELLSAECTITQARALATLKREGPKRLTDLATLQHVSQPSMSMLVARMESRGLVQRQAEPNLPRTTSSVNAAVSMMGKKKTPAIRALKRGDASAIRFIMPELVISISFGL